MDKTIEKELSNTIDVLGVKVSVTNLVHAYRSIERWIRERKKAYVCVAPVATIIDCQDDSHYKSIINGADMVTPDGMPLVWLGKLQGRGEMVRTYGTDLLNYCCELGQEKGFRHYFYGATDETLKLLVSNLKVKYPEIKIAGCYAPGLRDIRQIEEEEIIHKINEAQADILWVGLGSPKQDYWMFNHQEKLNVPVMVGVGAAFDFVAQTKPQAPRLIQNAGLEWFFRLCCEPKRLWKRYLIGNTRFLYLLAKNFINKKVLQRT